MPTKWFYVDDNPVEVEEQDIPVFADYTISKGFKHPEPAERLERSDGKYFIVPKKKLVHTKNSLSAFSKYQQAYGYTPSRFDEKTGQWVTRKEVEDPDAGETSIQEDVPVQDLTKMIFRQSAYNKYLRYQAAQEQIEAAKSRSTALGALGSFLQDKFSGKAIEEQTQEKLRAMDEKAAREGVVLPEQAEGAEGVQAVQPQGQVTPQVADDQERGFMSKVGADVARGIENVKMSTGGAARMLASTAEPPAGGMADLVKAGLTKAGIKIYEKKTGKKITPEEYRKIIDSRKKERSEKIDKWGQDVVQNAEQTLKQIDATSPEKPFWSDPVGHLISPSWWVGSMLEMAISSSPSLVAGAVGGPAGAGLVGGMQEAGPYYDELKKKHPEWSEEKRLGKTVIFGQLVAGLNAIGFDKLFKPGRGIRKAVTGVLTEMTTEAAEEPVGKFLEYVGEKEIPAGEGLGKKVNDFTKQKYGKELNPFGQQMMDAMGDAAEVFAQTMPFSLLAAGGSAVLDRGEQGNADEVLEGKEAETIPVVDETGAVVDEAKPSGTEAKPVEVPKKAEPVAEPKKTAGVPKAEAREEARVEETKPTLEEEAKKPETAIAEEPVIKHTQEAMNERRKERGEQPLNKEQRVSLTDVAEETRNKLKKGISVPEAVKKIVSKPVEDRSSDIVDLATMSADLVTRKQAIEDIQKKEKREATPEEDLRMAEINEQLELVESAIAERTTPAGRELKAAQVMHDVNTGDFKGFLSSLRRLKGDTLSNNENKKAERLWKENEGRIGRLQESIDRLVRVAENNYKRLVDAQIRKNKGRKPTQNKLKSIEDDIASTKEALRKTGTKVYSLEAATAEQIGLYTKLVKLYIQKGLTRQELVKEMTDSIPTLEERDVYYLAAGRVKTNDAKIRKYSNKLLSKMRREYELASRIVDALDGYMMAPTKNRQKTSRPVLRRLLNDWNKVLADIVVDDEQSEGYRVALSMAGELLESQFSEKNDLLPSDASDEIRQAAEIIKGIKEDIKTKKQIEDVSKLLKDLASKDDATRLAAMSELAVKTDAPSTRIDDAVSAELDAKKRQLRYLKRQLNNAAKEIIGPKPGLLKRMMNLYTGLTYVQKVGLDVGFMMNHLAVPLGGRPIMTLKAWNMMAKSLTNKHVDEMERLLSSNAAEFWREAGLNIGMEGDNVAELYANWDEVAKIPIYGRLVKALRRSQMNTISFVRLILAEETRVNRPDMSIEEAKKIADNINAFSGKEPIVARNLSHKASGFINNFLIMGVEWFGSRISTPLRAFAGLGSKNKGVRQVSQKVFTRFIASRMMFLMLAKAAGLEVGDDPEAYTWGKIKIGNNWWSPWGGLQPIVRTMVKAVWWSLQRTGAIDKMQAQGLPVRKMKKRYDFRKEMENMFRYRTPPPISAIYELVGGRTLFGEKVTPKQAAINAVTTLSIEDTVRTFKDEGLLQSILIGLAATSGGRIQPDYKKK